ncbi:MAG: UDP-N-acetylenolpyruvoylglucosamine reductase [Parcubacteria group bacterium GW2011_GWA2_47_7]|nr:MAG: UDP-N-acetylenolpyruvoylglucosamine reductase [Parcubacteria group bacterium GW2011_GWA2_47_7]
MLFEENVPLAGMTTMKVGGVARYFCTATTEEEVIEGVRYAKERNLSLFILGGGSNILVSDEGYYGLVMQIALKDIVVAEDDGEIFFTVDAGYVWDEFVAQAVARGAWGVENLSSIPGCVGGAVVQNIGAYGAEVKNSVLNVTVYDPNLSGVRTLSNAECCFGYRDSIWKHDGRELVVLRVTFRLLLKGKPNILYKDLAAYFLEKGNITPILQDIREAVQSIRRAKFPDLRTMGTAGSFFKNPIVTKEKADEFLHAYPLAPHYDAPNGNIKLSAAWIIDNILHLRGERVGNVGCFSAQALVIVNYGGASCEEIKKFTRNIITRTKNNIAITLEPEVIFVDEKK